MDVFVGAHVSVHTCGCSRLLLVCVYYVCLQSVCPPATSIAAYIPRLYRHFRCSEEVFVFALIYLDRVIRANHIKINALNIHRLVLAASVIGVKFVEDVRWDRHGASDTSSSVSIGRPLRGGGEYCNVHAMYAWRGLLFASAGTATDTMQGWGAWA